MSTWYEIEDPDDVDLSVDKNEVHILFDSDEWGNKYVSVPVEIIKALLNENT